MAACRSPRAVIASSEMTRHTSAGGYGTGRRAAGAASSRRLKAEHDVAATSDRQAGSGQGRASERHVHYSHKAQNGNGASVRFTHTHHTASQFTDTAPVL